jgi:protein involved in polysaccharide export with SLBB domain
MSSVLKSLLGAFCAVVLLAACASSGSSSAPDASFEPENVLTLGRGASDPSALPAPGATTPGAADIAGGVPIAGATPIAAPSDYVLATPTIQAEPVGNQNSYRLRARDFIRILVINEPDTQIERRINSDGTVDIPFLKKLVPVAGLTLTQAQVELSNQFRVYFKKPQVTISIVTYAERRVYVSGYVGKPGPVSIPPEETLTLGRALSMAGGVLPRGNRSDVAIKRSREGSTVVITKDVRRIDDGDEPDFILEDEDQIYVRDSRI